MTRIRIFDTTLRDGEQSPGATMTPAEKLRMAHQLDALGVDVIEAGFPVSSPDDYESVRKIGREVRRPVIAALARATPGDIDRAASALEPAGCGRIHVFLATSDLHLTRKLGIDRAACLARIATAVKRAREFTDDVEFSAEDATRTDLAFLCRVVDTAIGAGATTINVPDTVGYAVPADVRTILRTLRASVSGIDDVVLSIHTHDDLGLATANALAAIEEGARQVECTVNGIGERAGNTSLEEVVMSLYVRSDALPYHTRIHTRELYRTSQLLAHLTGIQPQPNKAVVGRNAFAHEAGIHQDGVLKDTRTYEIMRPETVGVPESRLVLGKHSGRHALARRFHELGYELDGEDLDRAVRLFKLLADQKKKILDEDLISIVHHGFAEDTPRSYSLRALAVTCGSEQAHARVGIEDPDGIERTAESTGDGPIAAAFSAIEAALGVRVALEDLVIRAATPGRDAVGEVSLHARVDGKTFTGRGASTDVVDAAARAFLHVLDKSLQARHLEARALAAANDVWGV
jgi:2-isopropylmalate synthase